MNDPERLKLAKIFAREKDLDVTWKEVERAHPDVFEDMSPYHLRRLAGSFEAWLMQERNKAGLIEQ